MSAEMPMMDHHSEMSMADHGMMMGPGFACGYCDLLVHVPLMLWVFIPFIWWMCLISRAPPPAAINPPNGDGCCVFIDRARHPLSRHTHCLLIRLRDNVT